MVEGERKTLVTRYINFFFLLSRSLKRNKIYLWNLSRRIKDACSLPLLQSILLEIGIHPTREREKDISACQQIEEKFQVIDCRRSRRYYQADGIQYMLRLHSNFKTLFFFFLSHKKRKEKKNEMIIEAGPERWNISPHCIYMWSLKDFEPTGRAASNSGLKGK